MHVVEDPFNILGEDDLQSDIPKKKILLTKKVIEQKENEKMKQTLLT